MNRIDYIVVYKKGKVPNDIRHNEDGIGFIKEAWGYKGPCQHDVFEIQSFAESSLIGNISMQIMSDYNQVLNCEDLHICFIGFDILEVLLIKKPIIEFFGGKSKEKEAYKANIGYALRISDYDKKPFEDLHLKCLQSTTKH